MLRTFHGPVFLTQQVPQSFQGKTVQLYSQVEIHMEKKVLQNHPKFSTVANKAAMHWQPHTIHSNHPVTLGNHPLLRLERCTLELAWFSGFIFLKNISRGQRDRHFTGLHIQLFLWSFKRKQENANWIFLVSAAAALSSGSELVPAPRSFRSTRHSDTKVHGDNEEGDRVCHVPGATHGDWCMF